jgi:DnaJ like chaperone protein
MDGLFHIAKADDAVHPAELEFLEQVAVIFGFQYADFERIKTRHVSEASDPFIILGVPRGASLAVIKARHRQLVRENHPDRHIAAGVPEEMIELATERLAQINAAYDQIVKRGVE